MKTPNSSRLTPNSRPQDALGTLKLLTTPEQFEVITDAMLGEEGDHFIAIIDRIHATWRARPSLQVAQPLSKSEAGTVRADFDF